MTHLIAFDLDGTLVDSRLDLAASANRLLEQLGAAPLSVEQVTGMVGEGARVLVGRVLAARGIETGVDAALSTFLEIYDQHLVDHTQLYPGVMDLLETLDGRAAVALLTNKPGHHTARLIEALGIRQFFFEAIGGDGAWPRKPDPAALEHLMAAADTTPATTIMVGDSMVDVETARRASARVCVAAYGFGHVPAGELAGAAVAAAAHDLGPILLDAIAT